MRCGCTGSKGDPAAHVHMATTKQGKLGMLKHHSPEEKQDVQVFSNLGREFPPGRGGKFYSVIFRAAGSICLG